jgi:alpha-L-fucosidase 2
LDERKDTTPGWSIGHRACVLTRLHQHEAAYDHVEKMLLFSTFPNLLGKCRHAPENEQPAIMPRYDDYNYPFQMDGNMGALTAFAEMMMQIDLTFDETGDVSCRIELLPCLPVKWKKGSVRGLRAKGGVIVDICWNDGKVTYARLQGGFVATVTIVVDGDIQILNIAEGEEIII